jgi:hypothetical protein
MATFAVSYRGGSLDSAMDYGNFIVRNLEIVGGLPVLKARTRRERRPGSTTNRR